MKTASVPVTDSVRRFLMGEVPLLERADRLDDDASLVASGLLDSIDLIKLVSFLERTFDIAIDASDVTAGHFETLSSIEKFVRARNPG